MINKINIKRNDNVTCCHVHVQLVKLKNLESSINLANRIPWYMYMYTKMWTQIWAEKINLVQYILYMTSVFT